MYEECKNLGVKFNLTKPVKTSELLHYLHHLNDLAATNVKVAEPVSVPLTVEVADKRFLRILVAEDVKMNMLLVTTLLKQIVPNSEILEARNGQVALNLALTQKPDLIFMDVQMPEMSGIEATIEIRSAETTGNMRVPIIALTAGAIKEERERCFQAGMDDFLSKPIAKIALQKIMEKYLELLTAN
jgi:CheY-like chemotaxis protein